ncbi:endoglucanase precursor [Acetivibrio straminisolvens JCM 21531]|uniref:Endoglucanase n=1 Tax=Acetivibrio straminisolvens JCM 21531 TaxID=1294263 RepID=W4VB86_9FIRM|nr:endoglucanase precursor [Acetivibrio straminisolvens JCM 21531]
MKKVISMIVVVAMLTTIFAAMIPQSISAAGTMTVEIGKVTGAVGTTVQIPVTLSGVPSKGIANGDFVLGYDPKVLDVTTVTAGI